MCFCVEEGERESVCGGNGSCTAGAAALSSTHLVCLRAVLANVLPPPSKAPTKAHDQSGASGDLGGGSWSEFTVSACGWKKSQGQWAKVGCQRRIIGQQESNQGWRSLSKLLFKVFKNIKLGVFCVFSKDKCCSNCVRKSGLFKQSNLLIQWVKWW